MAKKRKGSAIGIQVGASKVAILAARMAILDILTAGREEETTRAALSAFVDVTQVRNTTITGPSQAHWHD